VVVGFVVWQIPNDDFANKEKAYKKSIDSLESLRLTDSLKFANAIKGFELKIDTLENALKNQSKKVIYHEEKLKDYSNSTDDERFSIFADHLSNKDSISR
jgi:glutathione peroxidase-family protein